LLDVTSRDDLTDLVCGAFGRTPPLWARLGRGHNPDRIVVAPRQSSWRLERDSEFGTAVHVSDGVTMWLPTVSGVLFHASPAVPEAFPARDLLDPSWLAGYEWDTAMPRIHNDRDVLVVHAHLPGARPPAREGADDRQTSTVTAVRLPRDAEVVIDAEYGFLHRITELLDDQPFIVTELLDLMVDPPLDEDVFRIDPSRFQVIEHPESERPSSPVLRFTRDSPDPPPPIAWDDLGPVANDLQNDLEARVARLPDLRLRRFSDHILFQAVEVDHIKRLGREYSLSDGDQDTLQKLWFARFDSEMEEQLGRLRYEHLSSFQAPRWIERHHRLQRVWWNTFGPGGETWFGDHLPIRRFMFRLHWRP
jgi:hypothetical protein